MKKCHISSTHPAKQGSPFLLLGNDQKVLFDKVYRSAPIILGRPIKADDLLVSAKYYAGEDYQELLDKVELNSYESATCRFARSGDVSGLKRASKRLSMSFRRDAPLRLSALNGCPDAVSFILKLNDKSDICDKVSLAMPWALMGGSVSVVQALGDLCEIENIITEEDILQVAMQGDQRLFRYLVLDKRFHNDTEYIIENVRNKWAEDVICERIGVAGKSGTFKKRGLGLGL